MGVKAFHCDNISQEFDDSQLPIVKEWIEKRDFAIIAKDNRIDSLLSDLATSEKTVTELNTTNLELQKRIDELNGKLETVQSELEKRSDSVNNSAQIKARRQLERLVCDRIDSLSDDELDNLNDRDLKEKLIKTNYDFQDLTDRSDEMINGMFDMAVKYSKKDNFESKKDSLNSIKSNTSEDTGNFDMMSMLQDKANESRSLLFGGKK